LYIQIESNVPSTHLTGRARFSQRRPRPTKQSGQFFPSLPRNYYKREFFASSSGIRHALTDVLCIDELIGIWQKADCFDESIEAIPAVLAVDAVAFRPVTTTDESEKVGGIQGMDHLQFTDVFGHSLHKPLAFQDFLRQNVARTYALLFLYQIQPFNPELPCYVVRVAPAVHGKGDRITIERLQMTTDILQATVFKIGNVLSMVTPVSIIYKIDFKGCGNRLDAPLGDSTSWPFQLPRSQSAFPLVVTDPLHLLKRIRYRLLSGEFRVAPGGSTHIFTITKIHAVPWLPAIVFDNSRITKCMIHSHSTRSPVT
jgi:hypothetical protein